MTIYLSIAAIGLLALSLVPFLPFSTLFTDTASHFVLQYFIAGIFLALMAVLLHLPAPTIVLTAVIVLINAAQILPYVPCCGAKPQAGASLKILQANTLRFNEDTAPLKDMITTENPDIILASETNTIFADMFAGLSAYPYQQVIVSDNTSFGLAVLSKIPLENLQQEAFASVHVPSLHFQVTLLGRKIDILSLHTMNPLNDIGTRDREFDGIVKKFAAAPPENFIIAGDFNATLWCPAYKKFARALGMKNARQGRGLLGSYPQELPTTFLRLPIDHLLLRGNLAVASHRLDGDTGSDHLPLITVVHLTK